MIFVHSYLKISINSKILFLVAFKGFQVMFFVTFIRICSSYSDRLQQTIDAHGVVPMTLEQTVAVHSFTVHIVLSAGARCKV